MRNECTGHYETFVSTKNIEHSEDNNNTNSVSSRISEITEHDNLTRLLKTSDVFLLNSSTATGRQLNKENRSHEQIKEMLVRRLRYSKLVPAMEHCEGGAFANFKMGNTANSFAKWGGNNTVRNWDQGKEGDKKVQ